MYSTTPQERSGRAYMTYSVRYVAWLYLRLQLGDVPIALSYFLQFSLLGGGLSGIAPTDSNMCGSAPHRSHSFVQLRRPPACPLGLCKLW